MKTRIDNVNVDWALKRRFKNVFHNIANVLAKLQNSNAEWHKQIAERKILENNKWFDVVEIVTRRQSTVVAAFRKKERHWTKIDKHQQKASMSRKQHIQNENRRWIVRRNDENKKLKQNKRIDDKSSEKNNKSKFTENSSEDQKKKNNDD